MDYKFNTDDIRKIVDRFGESFLNKIKTLIVPLTLQWNITDMELIDSFSSNLIFKCFSTTYGPVVMKLGRNNYEFRSEINALKHFDENLLCELIDVDLENNVLLEECICPGYKLVSVEDLENRVNIFCELYKKMHIDNNISIEEISDCNEPFKFKSYKDWISKITSYMKNQESWRELSWHMNHAKELYFDISDQYDSKSLLHGDFHYYNILKCGNDYKIIDPKGVVENPIFDIPRYILNEFWDEEDRSKVDKTIESVFDIISDKLFISRDILSKLLYIEGTMAICWNIEDGADLNNKSSYLKMLEKLYEY